MSARSEPRLTPEQYLEIERAAVGIRSEYYNGRMYAMSGGTHPHAIVIGNLGSELRVALKMGPCVVTTSDMRVRVNKSGLYTYPDIVLVCDPPQFVDGRGDTLVTPTLIVEVLSPSTRLTIEASSPPSTGWWNHFRSTRWFRKPSRASKSSAANQRVTGYFPESAGMQATCRFHSLNCAVAVKEIYDKVTFEESLVADRPSPEV